jgi:hypothetical protein
MDELRQRIRAAEAARATCANVSEFERLILQQKERLDSETVAKAPKVRSPDENSDIKLIRELVFEPRVGAPCVARMVPGGGNPEQGGRGWPWILSDLKSLLETGRRMSA